MYHQLGLKFLSPTINLSIRGEEYLSFVKFFEQYIRLPLEDVSSQFDADYPVGRISTNDLPPVHLHFQHYKTFEQAEAKWRERCTRVNLSNLYFIWEFYDSLYDTRMLEEYDKLNRRKIAITHRVLPGITNQFTVTCYENDMPVAKIINQNGLSGKLYLNEWDYVHYLNHEPELS